MNTGQLLETIDALLQVDRTLGYQPILAELGTHLDQLASQPQQQQLQTALGSALGKLHTANLELLAAFDPSMVKKIEAIGAAPFFLNDHYADIDGLVQRNSMTPAVARDQVGAFVASRQQYLDTISGIKDGLLQVGVVASRPMPGGAELGFMIPRSLFDGELAGLISELREIRLIIRAFSEIATGNSEPIKVQEISTSDPLFIFGLSAQTIALFAGAVSWALGTWKQVEDIRNVRAKTSALHVEREKDLLEIFDKSIKETIETSIKNKVSELIPAPDLSDGRSKELENHLTRAFESLFARIERGMTVEIRFLPLTAADDASAAEDAKAAEAFSTLKRIAPNLVFPTMTGDPVLVLPRPADPQAVP